MSDSFSTPWPIAWEVSLSIEFPRHEYWSGLPIPSPRCDVLLRAALCFQFFTIRIMFAMGLSYIAFIMLRYVPSIPAFWRVFFFIINGCRILSKAFYASIEIIIWLLSFNLLMWCITLIDLRIFKNPCIPGIKPTWSWCMVFLICCWILFARILLRIFASMFISDISLYFLFLWHLCQVLVLGWWWPYRMSLEGYLPLQFSGTVWVG